MKILAVALLYMITLRFGLNAQNDSGLNRYTERIFPAF